MALVAEDGQEWYEVLHCENPIEWVAENVMPILFKPPIETTQLATSLQHFLSRFQNVHIVADWPEDIQLFCAALITGPGQRINTPPLTLEILRIDSSSEIPHNALYDARGVRKEVLKHEAIDMVTQLECDRCDGDGKAHGSDRPFEWSGPGTWPGPCPKCKGSGVQAD